MAKKEAAVLNVRLPVELKAEVDAAARAAGISITALLQQALELRVDMPANFWEQIGKAAEVLRLTPGTIIINKLIKALAFEQAWLEVFVGYPPSANMEFRFDSQGLVRGDELVEQLFEEFKAHLEEARAKMVDLGGEQRVVLEYPEAEAVLKGIKPVQQ